MNKEVNGEELYHYGVLGMKWGVHRTSKVDKWGKAINRDIQKGRSSRAFSKAVKRKKRLDRASEYHNALANAILLEAFSKAYISPREEAYYQQMSANERKIALRKAYQATEWGKRMEKEFANVSASSISEKDIAKGQEYAYMLKQS